MDHEGNFFEGIANAMRIYAFIGCVVCIALKFQVLL
jgi:hypothetical protein